MTQGMNRIGIARPPQMIGWHLNGKASSPILQVRLLGEPSVIWWHIIEWLLYRNESDHEIATNPPTNSLEVIPGISEHYTRHALAWTYEAIKRTNELAEQAEAQRETVEATAQEWYLTLPDADRPQNS